MVFFLGKLLLVYEKTSNRPILEAGVDTVSSLSYLACAIH